MAVVTTLIVTVIIQSLKPVNAIMSLIFCVPRILLLLSLLSVLGSCFESIGKFARSHCRLVALVRIVIDMITSWFGLSFTSATVIDIAIICLASATTADPKRHQLVSLHETLDSRYLRSQSHTICGSGACQLDFTRDQQHRDAEIEARGAMVLAEARRRFAPQRQACLARKRKAVAEARERDGEEEADVKDVDSERFEGEGSPKRSVFDKCDGFENDGCSKCQKRAYHVREAGSADEERRMRLASASEVGSEKRGWRKVFKRKEKKSRRATYPLPEIENYFCPEAPKAKVPWELDFEYQPFDGVMTPLRPLRPSTTSSSSAPSIKMVTPETSNPTSPQIGSWGKKQAEEDEQLLG